jgi:hypothetical protein
LCAIRSEIEKKIIPDVWGQKSDGTRIRNTDYNYILLLILCLFEKKRPEIDYISEQSCESETFCCGSGSDFSVSDPD